MKLVLIDGPNLAYRCLFSQKSLTHQDKPVGMIYGVLRSLRALKDRYPLHTFVVVWDHHSTRRERESQEGVAKGIVPASYKSSRRLDESPASKVMHLEFNEQIGPLKTGIGYTSIRQIDVTEFEADDVIGSIVSKHPFEQAVIVSSDHDFYALLRENVIVEDGIKQTQLDVKEFVDKHKVQPHQWVEIGALMGDTGDTIFGVPGVGEVRAHKYIQQHGTAVACVEALSGQEVLSKTDQAVLEHVDRILLAYSLKKIDCHLDVVIPEAQMDTRKLWLFFDAFGFESLKPVVKEF